MDSRARVHDRALVIAFVVGVACGMLGTYLGAGLSVLAAWLAQ